MGFVGWRFLTAPWLMPIAKVHAEYAGHRYNGGSDEVTASLTVGGVTTKDGRSLPLVTDEGKGLQTGKPGYKLLRAETSTW